MFFYVFSFNADDVLRLGMKSHDYKKTPYEPLDVMIHRGDDLLYAYLAFDEVQDK